MGVVHKEKGAGGFWRSAARRMTCFWEGLCMACEFVEYVQRT